MSEGDDDHHDHHGLVMKVMITKTERILMMIINVIMLKINEDVDKLLREMTMCKNINKDDNKETDYCDVDHALESTDCVKCYWLYQNSSEFTTF